MAATLLVSPLSSTGQVQAEETEAGEMEIVATENDAVTVSEGEEVKDKDYVVYIEMPDEEQDESGEKSENTDGESKMDSENSEDSGNEDTVSSNTVSENAPVENKESEDTDADETKPEEAESNETKQLAMEDVQKSIEEAEALLEEKSDAEEVVKDEEAIVYEADLTKSEIKELEESNATIYVEENIELFGASGKTKNKDKKEKSQKEEKQKEDKQKEEKQKEDKPKENTQKTNPVKDEQETDSKDKKKQSVENTDENQVKEPEWNIRMVNAVTKENTEGSEVDVAGSEIVGATTTGTTTDTEVTEVINVTDAADAATATGEKIKIAVMDSGIELLAGIPVQQINNMVTSEEYLPHYMNDMTGHGTAIAGIIHDIAPNAEIYSVRIMDSENKATLSRVVEGIYWCIENDIDIINMSFGTQTESKVLEKAIKDADKAGILMISSAGNGNTEGVEYPAAYEEVIAVGAVNTMAQKTEESAVGEEVELVAPGEQIISDSMLGLETVVSGTSMAAPHVTGAAAVLWQKDTTKSADFIRGLLSQAANNLGDAEEYGNGLIDLAYALEQYEEYEAGYQEAEQAITEQNDAEAVTERTEESTAVAEQEEETDTVASGTELTEEMLIEENESPVETYEDVDYVEGRWNQKGHLDIVDGGISQFEKNVLPLRQSSIEIFKLGAVYPDEAFPVKYDSANKVWHGGSAVNYVANYIYATQIAKLTGKTNSSTIVGGQKTEWFNLMKSQINSKRIMNQGKSQSWDVILKNYNYANIQDPKQKESLRSLFLYGVASHILADTYAHSAYCRCSGSLKNISDNHVKGQEDIITLHPDRFTDAKEAMYRLLVAYNSEELGTELDFAPIKVNEKRDYCLKKIIEYAIKAKTKYSEKQINDTYKAINC